MKELNIKLIFPYNWYHYRNVKVYDDKGKIITLISHCENQNLLIDKNIEKIIVKLDFFKSEILIPKNSETINLALFLNFRDTFPIKYFDVLKRNCLSGKLLEKKEFDEFNLSFYDTNEIWILKSKIDKSNLILGVLISMGLLIVSILEQQNQYQDLVFFISIVSLISLLMIIVEKNKLLLFDYKSRMIATGFALVFATFFLSSPYYIVMVLIVFSLMFLLKTFRKIENV